MKKTLLLLMSFSLLSNTKLLAQNWVNGGNSLGANGRFGTNTNFSVIFETNNIERGRISNGGNWAIGTTNALSRLHTNSVSGQSPFRASIAGTTKLLVASNGGTSIGSSSTPPTNGLYVAGNVGIGTSTPTYKLQVVGNASISNGLTVGNGGIFGYNSSGAGVYGSGSSWGLYGTSPGIGVYGTSTAASYGVYGNSSYIGVYGNGTSYGLYGTASTSSGWGVYGNGNIGAYGNGSAYGVYANGGSIGVYGTGPTYGVYGFSSSARGVYGNSTNGIGGYFYSANSYGLWAATGRTDNYYAAVFDGNTYCYNSYLTSDKSLKQNIEEFGNALSIINKLKPKYYEFRHDGKYAVLNLPTGKHYGLLAQELEEVLPNLVKEAPHQLSDLKPQPIEPVSDNGKMPIGIPVQNEKVETLATETIKIKAINYTELIPIMVKAMQELSKKTEEVAGLKELVQQQQLQIDNLKRMVDKLAQGQGLNMPLSSTLLSQNSPNPVKDATRIQYSLPEGSKAAHLLFTDNLGRIIKQLPLTTSGEVTFDASHLSRGVYNYSLVIDNQTIQTRKMIVEK